MGNKKLITLMLFLVISSAFGQAIIDLGDINNASAVLDPLFDLTTINQQNSHEVTQKIVTLEVGEIEERVRDSKKNNTFEQYVYRDLESEIMSKKVAPVIVNEIDSIMK